MRNIEIVELLLDKGAKVSAMDKVLLRLIRVMSGRTTGISFLLISFTEGRHAAPHCHPRAKPQVGRITAEEP